MAANVDNHFEQPVGGDTDNSLVLGGTVKGADGLQAPFVVDATDLATCITLTNALKAALINVGIMAPS